MLNSIIKEWENCSLNSIESSLTKLGFIIKSFELRSEGDMEPKESELDCTAIELDLLNWFAGDSKTVDEEEPILVVKVLLKAVVGRLLEMNTFAGSIAPISPRQEPKLKYIK